MQNLTVRPKPSHTVRTSRCRLHVGKVPGMPLGSSIGVMVTLIWTLLRTGLVLMRPPGAISVGCRSILPCNIKCYYKPVCVLTPISTRRRLLQDELSSSVIMTPSHRSRKLWCFRKRVSKHNASETDFISYCSSPHFINDFMNTSSRVLSIYIQGIQMFSTTSLALSKMLLTSTSSSLCMQYLVTSPTAYSFLVP
jgi:hypothetical protein